MPKKARKPVSSRAPHQSWLNSIPLGSLDQLQEAFKDILPASEVRTDPTAVRLPSSNNGRTSPQRSDDGQSQQAAAGALKSSASNDNVTSRSTGAGSLDQLEDAIARTAANVPLPRSMAPSVDSFPTPDAGDAKSAIDAGSLGRLENAIARTASNIPSPQSVAPSVDGIPAPDAENAESVHTEQRAPQPEQTEPANNRPIPNEYWRSIAPLLNCLSHLKYIRPNYGRHRNAGIVTCIDYFSAPRTSSVNYSFHVKDIGARVLYQRIHRLSKIVDSGVINRVVLVEDLGPELIDSLGSTFKIDPEFFAEHLNRSGYGKANYDEERSNKWETHAFKKPYTSVTWFHPVQQSPKVTEWVQDPKNILGKLRVSKDGQERTFLNSITWLDPEYEQDGHINESRKKHEAIVSTNIFRQNWPLSTRPLANAEGNHWVDLDTQDPIPLSRQSSRSESGSLSNDSSDIEHTAYRRRRLVPTAWAEKASFFRYEEGKVPIVILLLDPLPGFSDHQKSAVRRKKARGARTGRRDESVVPVDMGLPLAPRILPVFPQNKFGATESDMANLRHAMETLISTGDAIRILSTSQNFVKDPVVALLQIIREDYKAFCHGLEWALDEISQDSLDDFLMTRRSGIWRKLMSDLEIEIPSNSRSLEEFINIIHGPQVIPKEIGDIVDSINADSVHIKARLKEAYSALRTDMQFTESRRSISEAKAVTKLTELAFLFIPLSFTASLFSMSIQGLENPVPVWTFVVTALGLATLAYAARMIITSEFIAQRSRSALESFWSRRNVRRGQNVPVLTLGYLIAQEIWAGGGASVVMGTAIFLFVSAFVVVPVAFMWTSTNLDSGFNVAMTLFLLISGVALALLFPLGSSSIGETVGSWFSPYSDHESDVSEEDV